MYELTKTDDEPAKPAGPARPSRSGKPALVAQFLVLIVIAATLGQKLWSRPPVAVDEPPAGIRYVVSAEDFPDRSPTYSDLAQRFGLDPLQLAATLRANRGNRPDCALPDSALAIGSVVTIALNANEGEACLQTARSVAGPRGNGSGSERSPAG